VPRLGSRELRRSLHARGVGAAVVAVLTEGALAGVSPDWGLSDFLLDTAGPSEIDLRLRLLGGPRTPSRGPSCR
jgi:hypothetical protein